MVDDGILVMARSRTEHGRLLFLFLARISELRNFKIKQKIKEIKCPFTKNQLPK